MSEFLHLFNKKPIIGMIHLLPLPGSPNFDGDIKLIIDRAKMDCIALEEGGADSFIIENFGDIPYERNMSDEAFALMSIICSEVKKITNKPIGLNIQFNDFQKELALSYVLELDFVRVEVFAENRLGSQGIIEACADKILRLKSKFSSKVLLLTDIEVKHTMPLYDIPIEFLVNEAINNGSDGIILTGSATGSVPKKEEIEELKSKFPNIPFILGSGISKKNISDFLDVSDGVIVGSSIKKNGDVNESVDIQRIAELVSSSKLGGVN